MFYTMEDSEHPRLLLYSFWVRRPSGSRQDSQMGKCLRNMGAIEHVEICILAATLQILSFVWLLGGEFIS